MSQPNTRQQALLDALATRILVLDGAMGTMIHQEPLSIETDFLGRENCPEMLNITRPDLIGRIHRSYFEAGADIVETNTFGGMPLVLAEFNLRDRTHEINVKAVQIARQAADEYSTPDKPRFVAGSMGPTTKDLNVTVTSTFDQMRATYLEQARGLVDGGADLLLVETCFDTGSLKAALLAIDQLGDELGLHIPVIASVTIEQNGTMLAGQGIDALYTSIANHDLLAIGMNCATGPDMMTDHIRTLDQMSTHRISCYPNAGLPNSETGKFGETPESLAAQLEKFAERGWLNIVGGCCGTTPAHIKAISDVVKKYKPRPLKTPPHRAFYSGKELVEADESNRPLIVGERTNVIGSRLFKDMVAAEKWEEATDIGRRQVRNGAHVVDVCLQSSDRDEIKDIPLFYDKLMRKIKAPIMIDTTDPAAVELALTYCQGKSIINSINLEDGEEKFEKMCPIAHAYGAALIIGTIDEDKLQAQAFTRERKLAVAKRSVELATTKYKIPVEDLIIDPLVFPCATGDENYIGGAVETIEALRLIKAGIPFVKTVLGVSNISFGLPASAREVVNSVFLYHCTKAGLDLAIVNAEKLERFGSIPTEERRLAENLLFNTPPEGRDEFKGVSEDWRQQTREQKAAINQFHIAAVADHFRGASKKEKKKAADMPLDQRLGNYIIEGTKDGLVPDLNLKLKEAAPLDIVNGPLMAGMTEVGRLFNNNELIVAEVLQSAEAMKAAVNHLEQFMEKADTAARGKVVLATVKGDVHDIGKNLVEIILSNNGYTVINLGIKVPPEDLIKAFREHKPDAIGLSGLLVKSAHMMVTTAGDLHDAGIAVPLLVGGAALSEKFTTGKIGPAYLAPTLYAKDAMTGLRLMNELMDPASAGATRVKFTFTEVKPGFEGPQIEAVALTDVRSTKVRTDIPIPSVGYLDRRVRLVPNLDEVWTYINPYMLYGRHMGFKGNFEKLLAERDPKALSLHHDMEEVKNVGREFMKVRAVWRFFEAERDGNSIQLFEPGGAAPIHAFHYGRQAKGDGLCLSDFVLDPQTGRDHVALFVVTAGEGVRARSEDAKVKGEFFMAHGLQALAIETAEGCAEWLHRRIREDWGIPDPPSMTMQERFTSRYRGKRYSPGYPACPNLDDQQAIFKLLAPEEIGVELTEGMMMDPEASVSAIVFHHPDAVYFSAAAEVPAMAEQ
jgi:5-methyltetrahydrofolate--homocysteine methyltransferase